MTATVPINRRVAYYWVPYKNASDGTPLALIPLCIGYEARSMGRTLQFYASQEHYD
jgi:hypothetical protein